jgi:hypothetical protein
MVLVLRPHRAGPDRARPGRGDGPARRSASGMFLVRGVPWRHLVALAVVVALAVPTLVVPNLRPHQAARIATFLNPGADPQGAGYQVIQSTIAVGSGGLLGKGYGQGTQSQLGFIPFRQTDFIFPVLAEEGGFLAAVLLLGAVRAALLAPRGDGLRVPRRARPARSIVGVLGVRRLPGAAQRGRHAGLGAGDRHHAPARELRRDVAAVDAVGAWPSAFVVHRDRYAGW